MKEVAELLFLTSRENTSSMRLCLLEVSSVEECLSSVWQCLKDLDGMRSTTVMLNLSSMVKAKDAVSLTINAVTAALDLTSTVLEAAEDVLHMVEVVDVAKVIQIRSWTAANSCTLMKIMTVIMMMELIMQDFLNYKSSEEELAANASLETSTLESQAMDVPLSASNILVLEVDLILKLKFK